MRQVAFLVFVAGLVASGDTGRALTGPLSVNAPGRAVSSAGYARVADQRTPAEVRAHAFLWEDGKMIDLGTLGGRTSAASAINERGQIVGRSDTGAGSHAFLWHDGRMTDLGTLPGPRGKRSDAVAINDAGQVAGHTEKGFGSSGHAFLWQRGKLTDLGTLNPKNVSGGWSRVSDINERGQIVGWSPPPGGVMHAFVWQRGRLTDLGVVGRPAQSVARAINERGQIVGESLGAEWRAVLWQGGAVRNLGTRGSSQAVAINERGQIVGSSDTRAGYRAFLWESGKLRDLGTLGGKESSALSINEHGQVVGWSRTRKGWRHAFLWQNGKMRDLGTLGGSESHAVAINDRGQVVGTSTVADGSQHAFLWQDGRMRDLGTLGGEASSATAINEHGQVVGTSDSVESGPPPSSSDTIAYSALYAAPGSADRVPGIFTIRADGSHRWRLPVYEGSAPAWSPDGGRIAYAEQNIVVVRPDGTAMRHLEVGPLFCRQPEWSPDGNRIACAADWFEEGPGGKRHARNALYSVDLRTGKDTKLMDGVTPGALSWSPNGRYIAFDSGARGGGIFVLDLTTYSTRRIGTGASPEWSPDGTRILYSTGHTIAVMTANGSGRRTIVASRDSVDQPSWSPDGSRIVYAAFGAGSQRPTGLFIVRADGKQGHLLVRGGFEPDWRPA